MPRFFFKRQALCFGLCLFLIFPAWSADAFNQTLLTRDGSIEVQDAAIREAMRLMLMGLGGQPGIWTVPEYQELLAKAPLYVERFSYPKKFRNPWPRPMSIRFDRTRLRPLLGGLAGPGDEPSSPDVQDAEGQQDLQQTLTDFGVARAAPSAPIPNPKAVDLVIVGAGQGNANTIAAGLKKLSLVANIQPKGAREEGLAFGLGIYGSPDDLREALLISGLLEPASAPAPKKKAPPKPAFDALGDFQGGSTSSKPAAPSVPLLYFRLR